MDKGVFIDVIEDAGMKILFTMAMFFDLNESLKQKEFIGDKKSLSAIVIYS